MYCNIITTYKPLDDLFWFINRLFSYFMWLYPILYIFWKQDNVSFKTWKIIKRDQKLKNNINNEFTMRLNEIA